MTVRVGISGWVYEPWRGVFYPEGTRQKDELAYASRRLATIEINGTFYALQKPESFARWAAETPDGFVFSIKAPRLITHLKRLKGVEGAVANFLASGLLRLGPKLGPILWQLPPTLAFDPERMERFLVLLPHDTQAAAEQASGHEPRMAGRAWTETDAKRPLRHALEVRHESFATPAIVEMARRHRVALVCGDTVDWPMLMDVTADFAYCRMHGPEALYPDGYTEAGLDLWAARIAAWAKGGEPADAVRLAPPAPPQPGGRDVFAYVDHGSKVKAPATAQALARRLGASSA